MNINRRDFAACAGAIFLPFLHSRPGPVCIYETSKLYEDLPPGILSVGPHYTDLAVNWCCIRRIDLEMVSGRAVAVVWLQNSAIFPEPERAAVPDLPYFLADVAEYRRKVGDGR